MPDVSVSPIGKGGGRYDVVIKGDDGSKTVVQIRGNKAKVITSDSDGNTTTETRDLGGGATDRGTDPSGEKGE